MPDKPFDASKDTTVIGYSDKANSFAYRLWQQKPDTTTWTLIGDVTDTEPVLRIKPSQSGSRIGYFALVGGSPGDQFMTHLTLQQDGVQLSCTPPRDTGTCNDAGIGQVKKIFTLA